MSEQQYDDQPRIVVLWFEPSLRNMISEVLALENFSVTSVQTTADALACCGRDAGRCVVVIDNYHLNAEAQAFAILLRAREDLHERVRLVGIAIRHWAAFLPLDVFLALPFTVGDLLDAIRQAHEELPDSEGVHLRRDE